MLGSIVTKTIYEKRWAMLWWGLAMFALTIFVVAMFPTLQETFGQALKDVPESMQQVMGNVSDYKHIEGFLQVQVYMQMIFLTIIYAVILCTGLIAGEEGKGTLQALLAQPVSRTKVYFHKLMATAVVLWIICFMMFVAVWVGCLLIGESPDYWRVFLATNMMWLTSLVFGLFGYAIGAALGKRGVAGSVAGVYAFVAYLITSLAPTVDWLKRPNYLSPIRYFSEPRIMDVGIKSSNLAVLILACVIFALLGWIVFVRRDINSR